MKKRIVTKEMLEITLTKHDVKAILKDIDTCFLYDIKKSDLNFQTKYLIKALLNFSGDEKK